MAEGYDITRESTGEGERLIIGGFPPEAWKGILGEVLGETAVIASAGDEGTSGESRLDGLASPWVGAPHPPDVLRERPGSRADLHFLRPGAERDVTGGEDPSSRSGRVLSMRTVDGGRSVAFEAADPEILRDILSRIVIHALEAGGEALPAEGLPGEVRDRLWSEATRGVHLNPNRKLLRDSDLVLVGNLGVDFHGGSRPGGRLPVPVFRLVLSPRGEVRWEGPEEMPRGRYVRDHLDAWPGCLGPAAIVLGAAAVLIAVVLGGRACLAGTGGAG